MSADRPPSPNEAIKANSRFLRGTIADGLTRVETGSLSDDDQQLTKFHGIYVQDDRDLRAERGRKKMEKAFIFMARLRVPGRRPDAAAVAGRGTRRARARQRHAAADHAPDHPVPRHHQEQPAPRDPRPERRDARHHRRVRRREPQRHRARQSLAEPRARRGRRVSRRRSARICCRRAAPGTRSGSTARRSPAARRKTNRSTAAPTCRASSRSPWRCRRTTMSTCSPTISASSPSRKPAASSATTSWSAAAWA